MKHTERLLDNILMIAYDMLVSGSEVGRVEKQIEKMCYAYEMEEVEVFIITSSIIVSVKASEGKYYTQTKRIRSYYTDFYRIELLEQLITDICESCPGVEKIEQMRLDILKSLEKEHRWKGKGVEYMVFCIVSMIFTLFFDGSLKDGISAFLCGFFIKFMMRFVESTVSNRFIVNAMSSVTGGFVAWCFYKIGFADSIEKVIIGNIMLLIPGLSMVNAFKDLIGGEVITGLLRFADSVIQAGAVAIGFSLILLPLGR